MRFLLPLLFLIQFSIARAEAPLQLPALTSPVMDLGGFLSQREAQDLSHLAAEIYDNNGPQVAILTVPNLQGYPIEEYSIRVAERWQLGTKEKDNGLLVVISREERAVRIEVGNGIEGEITDYDTAKYTRDIFPEYFRRGDFHGALRLFLEDTAGKFHVKLSGNSVVRRAPKRTSSQYGEIIILLAFMLVFISAIFKKPAVRGMFSGAGFFAIAFLMGLPILVLIAAFLMGTIMGIIGIGNILASSGRYRGGGGFGGGGFGGGGGWSGGGGGFSGGGSSGRW